MKNNVLNILLVVVGIIILLVGLKVRYDLTEKQFGAGVDDLGVAKTILDFKDSLPTYKSQIGAKKIAAMNGANGARVAKVAGALDKVSLLNPLLKLRLCWNYIHAIPKSWTYAPLQFYFTTALIKPGMLYTDVKFWARFPSFVFSVLSVLVLALFCYRVSLEFLIPDRTGSAVLAVALSSLSWQHIAYAAQMHNLSIGVLAVSLLFLLLKNSIGNETEFTFKHAMLLGILLGVLAMAQYQLLLFFPGFVIAVLHNYYGRVPGKIILVRFSQILLGFSILAIPFVFSFLYTLRDNGINWNRGPGDIYLLNLHRYGPVFFSSIYAFFIFFLKNVPETVMAMLSPAAERNFVVTVSAFILCLFSLMGFISLFEKGKMRRAFLIFLSITFSVWIVLLLAQKITLSPSRHSMVLIPVFILLIILGIDSGIKMIFKSNGGNAFRMATLFFSISWLALFFWKASDGINLRNDPYEERSFSAKLDHDKVDFLLSYEATYSINLMPSVLSKYTLLEINDPWGARKEMGVTGAPFKTGNKNEFIFAAYSSARSLSLKDLQQLKVQFGNKINTAVKNIEIIREETKNCGRIIPDWAFPLPDGGYCGFYYTLIKFTV